MSKQTNIVLLAAVMAVVLAAGAVLVIHRQYVLYAKAYREHARQSLQEERLRNQAVRERETQEVRGLEEKGALIRLKIDSDESGRTVLSADGRVFGMVRGETGEELPDYEALHDYLVGKKNQLESSSDSHAIKVIIDASGEGGFKFVIQALNECVKAGIEDIEFAMSKTSIDEHFDQLERENSQSKQK